MLFFFIPSTILHASLEQFVSQTEQGDLVNKVPDLFGALQRDPPPPKSFYKNNNCIILFPYFFYFLCAVCSGSSELSYTPQCFDVVNLSV